MIRLRWVKNHPIPDEITRYRLNEMRETGILTDMIMSSGLRVYHCHKIVLSGASPFIRQSIQAASSGCEAMVVVAVNEEHIPYMNHLMGFLYLGVLLIEPIAFHGLCRLADKLDIKFLVDGVTNPAFQMAIPTLPGFSSEINHRPNPVRRNMNPIGTTSHDIKLQPKTKIRKKKSLTNVDKNRNTVVNNKSKRNSATRKLNSKKPMEGGKNAFTELGSKKPGKVQLLSPVSAAQFPCGSKTMFSPNAKLSLAKRLKKKALSFMSSASTHPSPLMKKIPRLKQRIVKNHEIGNDPQNYSAQNQNFPCPPIPIPIPQENQGLAAPELQLCDGINGNVNARPRRNAYRAAEIRMKYFVAVLRRRESIHY